MLDTTVPSNLAWAGQPRLVEGPFPELGAPEEVLAELRRGQVLGLLPEADWGWLPVLLLAPGEARQAKQFQRQLDRGEAHCLAIASSRGALLLTDDKAARRLARDLGVEVSGTLGALARLAHLRRLSTHHADTLLDRMIQAGYRSPIRSLREL